MQLSGSPVETSVPNSSCEVLRINEPVCDTVTHKLHSRGSHILIAEVFLPHYSFSIYHFYYVSFLIQLSQFLVLSNTLHTTVINCCIFSWEHLFLTSFPTVWTPRRPTFE